MDNIKIEQIDKLFRIVESCETSPQIIATEKFINVAEFLNEEEKRNFTFFTDYRKRNIIEREKAEKLNVGAKEDRAI